MRVAIARYIRSPDNYFFDLFDAAAAGALKAAGHDALVVERICGPGFDEAEMMSGLARKLSDFDAQLVILPYLPSGELARVVKAATRARIAAVGSSVLLDCPHVDWVLQEMDPLACVELAEVAEGRREAADVAGLTWRADDRGGQTGQAEAHPQRPPSPAGQAEAHPQRPPSPAGQAEAHPQRPPSPAGHAEADLALGRLRRGPSGLHSVVQIFGECPIDYSAFLRMGPGRPPEVRKHIAGDWGCPYRTARLSDAWRAGLALPESAWQGGCTFCTRPGTDAVLPEIKVELMGRQLDAVLEAFPDVRKLIVIDENALSYVDQVARLFASRPTEGVDLLVSGRIPHVQQHRDKLESALALLADRSTLRLYQFGIENLSDSVLQRYNKGMTYSDISAGIWQIRQLQQQWPNLGVEQSFGFILFDPWTTVAELKENAARAASLALDLFRGSAAATSLRLYPELPLYWKAVHDGLITQRLTADDFGYSAGSGWRFREPATERIFNRVRSGTGKQGWAALKDALSWTTAHSQQL